MKVFNSPPRSPVATFFVFIILQTVHALDLYWVKYPNFGNFTSPTGLKVRARSRLHCGQSCSTNAACVSFFYSVGEDINCHLEDTIISSTDSLQTKPNSEYYIPRGASVTTTTTAMPTTSTTTDIPTTVVATTTPQTTTVATTTASVPTFTCPADDSIFRTVKLSDNTNFTYRVIRSSANNAGASAGCSAMGAHLVRVSSVPKMTVLLELVACPGYGQNPYYVDGSNSDAPDPSAANAWSFSNGDIMSMSKEFWCDSCPNYPTSEHCVRMATMHQHKLNDSDCDNDYYYICEKDL